MSLPSYAIYWDKNSKEICRNSINIGWYVDKESWLRCVKEQVPKVPGADLVQVYGIKFAVRWLHPKYELMLAKLYDERLEIDRAKNNIDGHLDIIRPKVRDVGGIDNENAKVVLAMIRKDNLIPKLLAYDIVGVQPMTEPCSLIYTLRNRYENRSWYQKVVEYVRKVLFEGDDRVLWGILGKLRRETLQRENEEKWLKEKKEIETQWEEVTQLVRSLRG